MDIAIIDNDAALLRSMAILLAAQGHRVRCFNDPHAAIRELSGEPAEGVIVDLIMPGLDGFETFRRLKQDRVAYKMAILITGHTDLLESIDIRIHGFDSLLTKPIDGEALLALVEASAEVVKV